MTDRQEKEKRRAIDPGSEHQASRAEVLQAHRDLLGHKGSAS